MKFINRTPIQLGMRGAFAGIQYRVAGRVVMSMDEAGSTYYWDEFHLVADDGRCATLVHEEIDGGPQWRLFSLIEPARPISAEEAASKRVGDQIDFTGTRLPITTADESRVCHIDGEAPEGVEVGDVARYFNAERGSDMVVVSWTGDEVECYRGLTLPGNTVTKAFGIPDEKPQFYLRPAGTIEPKSKPTAAIVVSVSLIVLVLIGLFSCKPWKRTTKEPKLPPAPLKAGASGNIANVHYRIARHATVEVGQVGHRFRRHEYPLAADSGTEALLVCGNGRDKAAWSLLVPFTPETPLVPAWAGTLRPNQPVQLSGAAMVTGLFRIIVKDAPGETWAAEKIYYGFNARGAGKEFVVRWDENATTCYLVMPVSAKVIRKSFAN